MNDVPMLVSAINFLLRDHEFDTLDEICNHFNVNRAALEAKMATQGFEWSEQQKKRRSLPAGSAREKRSQHRKKCVS